MFSHVTFSNMTTAALNRIPSGTTASKIMKCVTSAKKDTDLEYQSLKQKWNGKRQTDFQLYQANSHLWIRPCRMTTSLKNNEIAASSTFLCRASTSIWAKTFLMSRNKVFKYIASSMNKETTEQRICDPWKLEYVWNPTMNAHAQNVFCGNGVLWIWIKKANWR